MPDEVKTRRSYRSTKRAEQAAQTRRGIVATAGALFRERGYAGVSMPVIASEAGVAVETLYRAFESKAGLFRAVMLAAVAGGAARAEVPVEERPAIRAVIEESDPRRLVALYAATQPGIHRRSVALSRALLEGAASDPDLRGLWNELEAERRAGQGRVVTRLANRGALRAGLSVEEGGDALWALCSHQVYELLVGDRGWTNEQYEAWLAKALQDLLLDD
jgi:TetR/AcrR family transcriptional regulator, regulator of autoinduction and epiphytic fitness